MQPPRVCEPTSLSEPLTADMLRRGTNLPPLRPITMSGLLSAPYGECPKLTKKAMKKAKNKHLRK